MSLAWQVQCTSSTTSNTGAIPWQFYRRHSFLGITTHTKAPIRRNTGVGCWRGPYYYWPCQQLLLLFHSHDLAQYESCCREKDDNSQSAVSKATEAQHHKAICTLVLPRRCHFRGYYCFYERDALVIITSRSIEWTLQSKTESFQLDEDTILLWETDTRKLADKLIKGEAWVDGGECILQNEDDGIFCHFMNFSHL